MGSPIRGEGRGLDMCGICGIWTSDLPASDQARALNAMCDAQIHRGPDGSGSLERGRVMLGMRRLSIIDLERGDQPIYNEDRKVAVVFNGEIYNYRELRTELTRCGHALTTHSDTETIVHAYEEWGNACVDHLRGMFAFAILDSRESGDALPGGVAAPARLFIARDRLGIKPLYWYRDRDRFVFASEVRALLASGLVPKCISPVGLATYLAFGSVQEPFTLIEGVESLPPGHHLTLRVNGGPPLARIERYWDLPAAQPDAAALLGDSRARRLAVARIRASLEEAVALHTRSDVPFGAFLSSGIDSSAIVGLMARASDVPVRTFTIAFNEAQFSEDRLARQTAARYGTDHHEILVRPSEVLEELPRAVSSLDQPSMDGINTYYVSGATRRTGIKVALSGLGSDEIFAGYSTFLSSPRLTAAANLVPKPIRALIQAAPVPKRDRWRKLRDALSSSGHGGHPYFTLRALFTPAQRDSLLPASVHKGAADERWRKVAAEYVAGSHQYDAVNATSYLECQTYLRSTLLRDTDAMSMAHSLEVRVPFLDHVVVEQVFALPGALKVDSGVQKPLLVDAVSDLLGPEISGQRKRTFTFPWERWLRGELRPLIETRLTEADPSTAAVFDPVAAREIWTGFLNRETSWSRVWALYVLASWADRHLR